MNIRKPKNPPPNILRIQIDGMPELIKAITNGFLTINQKLNKMAADLTTLEQEVSENSDAIASAVTLLQGLKAALDAAGTDPVKLKALSDQLSAQTDSLAAAVVANTPSETTEDPE